MRTFIAALAIALCASAASAQVLDIPSDGDNQQATVTQHIGVVAVTIDYHSPDVHAPNGEDRRGKIWGKLVPYGLNPLGYGTCTQCPWRAGANQNTTFAVTHDVKINGQPLPAGKYGLSMIVEPNEWTLIFSKNAAQWGSFFYDPKDDALRVKVKPGPSEYHEWLTYEFTDRQPDHATVAMKWEDVQVPWTISVDDITALHLASVRNQLHNDEGFSWTNWLAAAQYAIAVKHPAEALEFADAAAHFSFVGQENFQTLTTLALAQEMNGKLAEANASREKALASPAATALELHGYGRQLLAQGKKDEALKVFELNAKRHPNEWPVNFGLARGYSAVGRFKDALKYAKLAVTQAPDEGNRRAMEDAAKRLEEGKDIN
ncbi:MAG TPA: DUF2911 domain-containing protein [Thermoanaerobaculia bacterium]|nr:DUF2911 domain-containing protein [Thermoanaerobaculia bacterium]